MAQEMKMTPIVQIELDDIEITIPKNIAGLKNDVKCKVSGKLTITTYSSIAKAIHMTAPLMHDAIQFFMAKVLAELQDKGVIPSKQVQAPIKENSSVPVDFNVVDDNDENTMNCSECGASIKQTDITCPKCGLEFEGDEEEPEEEETEEENSEKTTTEEETEATSEEENSEETTPEEVIASHAPDIAEEETEEQDQPEEKPEVKPQNKQNKKSGKHGAR